MDHAPRALPDPRTARLEVLQAWATLLPAALLVLPILHGVPSAASAGAGWTALLSLPAALLLLLRRASLPALPWLALVALVLGQSVWPSQAGDTFGASQAHLILVCGVTLLLSAASLGARGRAILARGSVLCSAAWVLGAAFDTLGAPQRDFAGVLENKGDLAEAALPGALVALGLAAGHRGGLRLLFPATLLAFGVYALAVPVHAASVSLFVASAAAVCIGRRAHPGRARLALLVCVTLALAFAARTWLEGSSPAPTPVAQESSTGDPDSAAAGADGADGIGDVASAGSFGGVAFRRRTWPRTLAMAKDAGLFGVGPGQFAARFPAWRDPADIEAASFGRTAPFTTEVEHAHNDYLTLLAERGPLAALAGLAALGWLLLAALRALAGPDPVRGALALGTLGLLTDACANAPLLEGPAAHALAFAFFGSLLPAAAPKLLRWRVALLALPLAALLWHAPRALALARHGAALAPLSKGAQIQEDGRVKHGEADKRAAIERALEAAPDSPMALSEQAHMLRTTGHPEGEVLAAWEAVLALRPLRLEALLGAGNAHARMNELDAARELYARAEGVDPGNAALLTNSLLLALQAGDGAGVAGALARLGEDLEPAWLERTAGGELLRGRPHLGLPLLTKLGHQVTSAEQAMALAPEVESSILRDGLEALAHQLWARDFVDQGAYHDAVRLYRQSLRVSRQYSELPSGARRVRMEMAAALILEGREDEAREELGALVPGQVERAELPAWASGALAAEGLLGDG